MKKINNISIFCGSSSGYNSIYTTAAKELALAFAKNNLGLVYGGASVGLMGILADTVLSQSGKVFGVIPQSMVDVEIAHTNLTELYIVKSMHERKEKIAELSDAFILLPGGAGSLDEFFEIFTWLQLGYHNKPCAIFNINNYYDGLLKFIDHAIAEGFMKPEHKEAILVDDDAHSLLSSLFSFAPALGAKWIRE
jgi:uncharacterized protein (TIGR00730 family)